MATTKKANRFSIFKHQEHDAYGQESLSTSNFNTVNLNIGLNVTKYRAYLRVILELGEDSYDKIRYFDRIAGCRFYGYVHTLLGLPEVRVRELNDDVTKMLIETGVAWAFYKDGAAFTNAGALWRKNGGDFGDVDLAQQYISASPAWYEWEFDEWARSKGLEPFDSICVLLKEDESSAEDPDYCRLYSKSDVTAGVRPTSCWRGDEFGGGDIYLDQKHTQAEGSTRASFFELVYEDDIPEQPTDFKLVPNEESPERVELEFSESPDEDVLGCMLFATSDPKNRDFDSLKWLDFDAQTVNFTAGDTLLGGTSGATGFIVLDRDAGATGTVVLAGVKGTFVDGEALTDDHAGDGTVDGDMEDLPAWGWVDKFDAGAGTVTCGGQRANWPVDCWNNYKMIMINGKNKGKIYTISDTSNLTGILTITETIEEGEFGINDMYILVKDTTTITTDIATYGGEATIYAVETNRGFYWEEAPSEDYPVWIKDMTQFTANDRYHFFVQAIDNLGMGERGAKSNIISYVIPQINNAKDFNIASVNDDDTGTGLDIYEEVYPAIYTVGLDNTETTTPGTSTTGLKDKVKYEIETGEYRYLLDTYVTTLTSAWAAGTTISLDLDAVPKTFFRVGQKVCIIDRDATPTVVFDIRTITGIGDNSITVDAAPGHTFRVNTSQIYPVKTFMYTKTGTKTGIIKARTINEEGFASPWQTPNTDPAPIDIPGIGSLMVGPTEAEKDSTKVNFNMNLSRPKDSVATITKYALDMDDGLGDTDYDEPVQTLAAYTSTGAKQPFSYIYDSNNIISPAFGQLWDYVAIGAVWNPRTIVGRTHDAGSPMDAMNAVNDIMYMGFERPNDGVYVQMVTTMNGMTFDKEYWDGAAWQTLTVTDGTVNMTQNGKIVWTPPADWEASSVNSSPTLFFVRFTVTAITATTDFFILVPLELGNNFAIVTVIDPTLIDLDSVFVDGFEKHQEEHPRRIYAKSGILGHLVKQGIKLIATFTLNGHSHNINDNYLSGFDASGVALFAGAANTDNRLDDLQILDNIIENGRLVTFKDDAGNTHTGYLSGWGLPTRMEGMPVANWQINFIPDPNR